MAKPQSFQVAVIGAGPAGSAAAGILAAEGMDVVLLERRRFPRTKLCAGLLTAKTINCLAQDLGLDPGIMEATGIIYHRLESYRIYHRHRLLAAGRLSTPFRLTERRSFDALLSDQAARAGAQVRTQQHVTRIMPETGGIETTSGEQIRAQIIIGADGVRSKARAALFKSRGISSGTWRQGLAMALEARAPGGRVTVPRAAELHFGYLPWGYGWSFPSHRHRIVGICGLKGDPVRGFRRLLNALGLEGRSIGRPAGWPLPYGNYLTRPWHGRLLLAGDACGLADPLLGEGIYYALKSGLLAARAVLAASARPQRTGPFYGSLLKQEILPQMRRIKLVRNILFGSGRLGPLGLEHVMTKHSLLVEKAIQGQIGFADLWGRLILKSLAMG